jgi:hypothetical protein
MIAPLVDHTADLEPGPVNLDGMDQSELYTFIAATRGKQPDRAARRMFKGESLATRTVRWLNQYARNKVVAMACRSRGEVQTALMYENICERYYVDLPEYARW